MQLINLSKVFYRILFNPVLCQSEICSRPNPSQSRKWFYIFLDVNRLKINPNQSEGSNSIENRKKFSIRFNMTQSMTFN